MADEKCKHKQISIFDGTDLPTRHSPKGEMELLSHKDKKEE